MDAKYTHRFLRIAAYLFFFLMLSNLIFLNMWIYRNNIQNRQNNSIIGNLKMGFEDKCGDDCLTKINEKVYEATSSLKLSTENDNINLKNYQLSSSIKEFYISFGGGSNSTDDWADVAGLQVEVDSAKYGNIKSVVFEATVNIPTGNQITYVRLFNVTDKHPVWFSDLSVEGEGAKLLLSQPITLDSGNKLYQVQMKTSLKRLANLIQARLHITME